jgi:hypothetical protein
MRSKLLSHPIINTLNSCHNVSFLRIGWRSCGSVSSLTDSPLESVGNVLSNRYQPYPQLDVLSLGQHLIFGKQRKADRQRSRSQLGDQGPDSGIVQPLAQALLQSGRSVEAIIPVNPNPSLSTVLDCDVEMDEAACVPEMDLLDVEMEDDFLPQIHREYRSCTLKEWPEPTRPCPEISHFDDIDGR